MQRYHNLQAMRGIAAMIVFFIHSIAMPESIGVDWAIPFVAKYGPAGVDIFFVISGFIIATVAHYSGQKMVDGNQLNLVREFVTKRLIRVYPIYWIVLILATIASTHIFLAPATVPSHNFWALFFLLEPSNNKIMAAWTLAYEMYFYFVVSAVLFLMPRNVFKGLVLWSLITLVAIIYLSITNSSLVWRQPFNPILIEFMLGILVAIILHRNITIYPIAAIGLGILLFLIGADVNAAIGNWTPWYRTICFGPASALIIYGVLAIELKTGWVFSQRWQTVGDASYSIYIWHQLIFYSLFAVSKQYEIIGNINPILIVLIWMAIVLVWSISFYFLVEKRILKVLENLFITKVRERSKSATTWGLPYNYAFIGLVALLPLSALLYANITQSSARDNSSILASWPPSDEMNNSRFVGDPSISAPASIKLPSFEGYRTLRLSISSSSSSAIYVGYRTKGKLIEAWYNFGPNGVISIGIPGPVDGQAVWLNRDPKMSPFSVSMVELLGG